jgi:hypothetical protein
MCWSNAASIRAAIVNMLHLDLVDRCCTSNWLIDAAPGIKQVCNQLSRCDYYKHVVHVKSALNNLLLPNVKQACLAAQ